MLSTRQIAAKIGCSNRTVQKIAAQLGVGQLVGNSLAFTEQELPKIQAEYHGKAGNPNMIAGNYFAKPKNNSDQPIDAIASIGNSNTMRVTQ